TTTECPCRWTSLLIRPRKPNSSRTRKKVNSTITLQVFLWFSLGSSFSPVITSTPAGQQSNTPGLFVFFSLEFLFSFSVTPNFGRLVQKTGGSALREILKSFSTKHLRSFFWGSASSKRFVQEVLCALLGVLGYFLSSRLPAL